MDTQKLIESLTAEQLKTDMPRFDIGDTINVHYRIVEGDKERIQVFQGVLIARRGSGTVIGGVIVVTFFYLLITVPMGILSDQLERRVAIAR